MYIHTHCIHIVGYVSKYTVLIQILSEVYIITGLLIEHVHRHRPIHALTCYTVSKKIYVHIHTHMVGCISTTCNTNKLLIIYLIIDK